MSLLISDEALALIEAAGSDPAERFHHRRAAARLDDEFGSPRRFGLGLGSLVGIVVAGFVLGLGVESIGDDGALALLGLAAGLAIGAPSVWLGIMVVRAGDRVRRAYARWVADDAFGSPGRGSMVTRLFSGRNIVRSALAAFALIVAVFAWSCFGLALAPSDLADLRLAFATMSLIWAVAFTASAYFLVAGEVRMGWAHSQSVIRGL
ncbi:hypothetical protein [Aeromicrobium fastidiosum]|uniref:Uncharacterized protein n=1 Tax=Aeromicrobium fastidiosum TaxID=52699 RepID=A0A641AI88_9ACTN|nr:hypothetical protein [Aeromicrobium fastidiosum]KAA1372232.1 hypothetical protein ESP62_019280 [Aeromicrobium fastidiosum]MBP2391371.1 hypothetical protein [Aeromicrobium fastidiosum]